MESNLW